METNYNKIGRQLQVALFTKSMSRRALARKLGVSHTAINFWIGGKRKISRENRLKLQRILPEMRTCDE